MFNEAELYHRMQHDFPLHARPYQPPPKPSAFPEHTVLSLLARDLGNGRISRIGAVFARIRSAPARLPRCLCRRST
jgi:hypothetical protein